MSGLAQQVDGVAQREVTHSGEPVERIQIAAGVLDHLERLGQLAERLHGLVGHAFRTPVFGCWGLHPATVKGPADRPCGIVGLVSIDEPLTLREVVAALESVYPPDTAHGLGPGGTRRR